MLIKNKAYAKRLEINPNLFMILLSFLSCLRSFSRVLFWSSPGFFELSFSRKLDSHVFYVIKNSKDRLLQFLETKDCFALMNVQINNSLEIILIDTAQIGIQLGRIYSQEITIIV